MSEPHQEQKEIENKVRQMLDQYNYFIIGICIAAIGFSVHQTIGASLSIHQIPLGLATIFWGLGIHFGLRAISFAISKEAIKHQYFESQKQLGEFVSNAPFSAPIAEETLNTIRDQAHKTLREVTEKANSRIKWQYRFFILGIFCFLVWHIIEMYFNVII